MSNRSNVLPWTIAGIAGVLAAGALGFMAGRYSVETPAPATVPPGQQQAEGGQPRLPPGTTTEKMGDWTLFCQDVPNAAAKSCFAMQETLNQQGKLMLAVMAFYDNNASRAFLVRTPLGVQIDAGVEFAMPDKKPEAFSYSACTQISCDAVLTVSEEGFKQLTDAGKFELAYTRGGQRVASTISMAGLGDAFGRIERPTPPAAPAAETAPAPAGETPLPQPAPKPETP